MIRHTWFLVLLLAPGVCYAGPRYDVLIVRDSSSAEQRQFATRARKELEQARTDLGLTKDDLYVDEYDVNNAGQKPAVQRLSLTHLPALAVCSLANDIPATVQARLESVPLKDTASSCSELIIFVARRLGVQLPYLGVDAQDLSADLRQRYSLADTVTGGVVTNVTEGSPAALAGIQVGDVVQEIGGMPVLNGNLFPLVRAHKIGETVSIKVLRGGTPVDVPVTMVLDPQVLAHGLAPKESPTSVAIDTSTPNPVPDGAQFSDMVVCKSVTASGVPSGVGSSFPKTTTLLRARWRVVPRPVTTSIELKLYFNDEMVANGDGVLPANALYGTAHLDPPYGTFEPGTWRVDICQKGRVLCSQTFTVH